MSFSLFPTYKFKKLTSVKTEFLRKRGISLLMLDLDNTIAPYGQEKPDTATLQWVQEMTAGGIVLFIVSNSKKQNHVSAYAAAMGIDFVYHAHKPSPQKLLEVCRELGVEPCAAAFAGDQIFTDVLAANRAGASSILVRPIKFTNIFLALRYIAEQPFRLWWREQD